MKESIKRITQIFWGNGRGKTSCAIGTGLRACGAGYKVHLIQLMKNGTKNKKFEISNEIKAISKFENFSFKRFGSGSWIIENPSEKDYYEAEKALDYVKKCFRMDYDVIIMDEILYALQFGLLNEEEIIELIKNKPRKIEFILTGSHKKFPKIFEVADLVTEIKKIKHPYDSGILARRGFDY